SEYNGRGDAPFIAPDTIAKDRAREPKETTCQCTADLIEGRSGRENGRHAPPPSDYCSAGRQWPRPPALGQRRPTLMDTGWVVSQGRENHCALPHSERKRWHLAPTRMPQ